MNNDNSSTPDGQLHTPSSADPNNTIQPENAMQPRHAGNEHHPSAQHTPRQPPAAAPFTSHTTNTTTPAPPGQYAPSPPPAQNGATTWALGFLSYIPIPFLGVILVPIAQAINYSKTRKRANPLAIGNARNALNWGITFATSVFLSMALLIITLILFPPAPGTNTSLSPGIFVAIIMASCVTHLVITILGTIKASQHRIFNPKIAIPFIRTPAQNNTSTTA